MAVERTEKRNLRVVTISEAAAREVARLLSEDGREGIGLRLGVKGGGCSGLSYIIDFDHRRENDFVDEQHGITVLCDPKSGLYLKDVVLDFVGGINSRGFRWVNPHASNTCGCGESFSV